MLLLLSEDQVLSMRKARSLPRSRPMPRMIDLFCGAGGMSLGFSKSFGHRFKHVWANDIAKDCVSTYNRNFGNIGVVGDLVEMLESGVEIPSADIVIGGPPCQGFSLLNKKRHNDPRKQLWRPFMEVVKRCGANLFVMENVPQLLTSAEMELIEEECSKLGFMLASSKLCAADYGVPQKRYRAIVIGCSFLDPHLVFPPLKTHFDPDANWRREGKRNDRGYIQAPKEWTTVKHAISDLRSPHGTEISDVKPPYDLHFGRNPTEKSLARYKAIPKEGMNRFDLQERAPELTPICWIRKKSGGTDLFGRLWWKRPAYTIRTEFFKPEKGRYLHPTEHRPITHREAARLQGFPDDFKFIGSKIEIARQIGNAVPPPMAARIADTVFALWMSRSRGNGR